MFVCSKENDVHKDLIKSFFEDVSNLIIRDEADIRTDMEKYYLITKILQKNGYDSNRLMLEVGLRKHK